MGKVIVKKHILFFLITSLFFGDVLGMNLLRRLFEEFNCFKGKEKVSFQGMDTKFTKVVSSQIKDSIFMLCDDVLEEICGCLSPKEVLRDLFLIDKQFNRVATINYFDRKNIVITEKMAGSEDFRSYLLSLDKKVRSLSIVYRGDSCNEEFVYREMLRTLFKMKRIRNLDLFGRTQVTDTELKCLGGFENLYSLNLCGCCKITDVGLQCLGRLEKLYSLDLGFCWYITDEGLEYLGGLENLRVLNLYIYCGPTKVGLSKLKAKLPDLKIIVAEEMI